LAAKLQREQQRLGSSVLAKEELSIYSQEQLNAIAVEVQRQAQKSGTIQGLM
jgi:hypothetical protein